MDPSLQNDIKCKHTFNLSEQLVKQPSFGDNDKLINRKVHYITTFFFEKDPMVSTSTNP